MHLDMLTTAVVAILVVQDILLRNKKNYKNWEEATFPMTFPAISFYIIFWLTWKNCSY